MKVEVQGVDVINLNKFVKIVSVQKTLLLDADVTGFGLLILKGNVV